MNSSTNFCVLRAALLCWAMLARYTLAIIAAPMTVSTRYASLNPQQVKSNIECVGCALDVNGDGIIDAAETSIIAWQAGWLQGASQIASLALGVGARNAPLAVSSFLAGGCASGGGCTNGSSGEASVVDGGFDNIALGASSAIRSGSRNRASGRSSCAAGQNANPLDSNSFVWGARGVVTSSAGIGSFGVSVPSSMSIVFYATSTPGVGRSLSSGASWFCTLDRATKQRIRDVTARDVLNRVISLAVPTWGFIGATNHPNIGPMAQDFKKTFGLDDTDKAVSAMAGSGVALAAIPGLNQKLVVALKHKYAELKAVKHELLAIKCKLSI